MIEEAYKEAYVFQQCFNFSITTYAFSNSHVGVIVIDDHLIWNNWKENLWVEVRDWVCWKTNELSNLWIFYWVVYTIISIVSINFHSFPSQHPISLSCLQLTLNMSRFSCRLVSKVSRTSPIVTHIVMSDTGPNKHVLQQN